MAASAVLNGARTSSRISAATRQRILKAAASLSYRPNIAARALANRRMHAIGVAVVIDGVELNHYFLEVFNGLLEAAARHEQNATVFTLHDWDRDIARLHGFCDGRIDGLVLLAPTFQRDGTVLPTHTPFVAIHANAPIPKVVNIESDEERGACGMVRHFVDQGHRRIMHITGPAGMLGTERRIRGYQRALAEAQIPFDAGLMIPASFLTAGGHEAMGGWLRRNAGQPLPHAIFCVNDNVAIGCLEALAEVGLRVPEDISVAGFDDTLVARSTVPQLTTVRQPLRAMGQRAVEVLLAKIDPGAHKDAPVPDQNIVFPVELVLRDSVAPPPVVARLVPPPR
jgi:LacI family transcriptional regulator